MPARTGNTTYIPGRGAITSKPSGKKTFVGKGPAPSGAEKVPEPTVAQATAHPAPSPAGVRARAMARTQRMRGVLRATGLGNPKRASRPTGVKAEIKAPPAKLAKIQQAVRANAREFKAEQTPTVKVVAHTRAAPKPKLHPAQEHPAAVKKVKAQLHKLKSAGKPGQLHSAIVSSPEQSKIAKTLIRTGQGEHANRKEKLAALTAGAQESGMKNLPIVGPGGGWRQEESAFFSPADIRNPKKGAENFYREAKEKSNRGRGESVAHLTQAIQGSGAGESYYVDNVPEAKSLLRQFNQGKQTPQQQAQFKRVEAKANRLGIDTSLGLAPKRVVTRYKAGLRAAEELAKAHIPYPTPDQHFGLQGRPAFLDCSAAVSWVLNKMGVLKTELVSGEMGSVLKPGPGAVTVFYNAGHTFMSFGGRFFGTSVNDSSKGLAFYKNPGSAYLSQYSVGHVAGLGQKQALQLGLKAPDAQSFPGMSLSSSGTSATINSGAGATVSKPGFSNKPIQLTPRQKFKTLEQLGVGVSPSASDKGPSVSTLKALDKKYGAAA